MNGLSSFYLFIAAFSISQIVLAIAKILSTKQDATKQDANKKPQSSEILFCGFLFCVGIYLSQPLIVDKPSSPFWLSLFWQHLPTAIPALFMLCCASIFLDNFHLRAIHLLSIVITALPPLVYDALQLSSRLEIVLVEVPQVLEYLCMFTALFLIARSWRADLIEQRRQLRFWVMGVSGALIFSVILAQQLSSISEAEIDLLHYPVAALLLFLINLFLLKLNPDIIMLGASSNETVATPVNEANTETKTENRQLMQLQHWMETEKGYRNQLTITELAWKLKLPEYKLRELINQGMGFRNFNEYLNHYRIKEACERLLNSDESITHIANEVGFNTLSAFNRAFKDSQQSTPSSYRKQKNTAF